MPETTTTNEGIHVHTAYADLSIVGTENFRHAWDQYADGDLLGSLNRLGREGVLRGVQLVVSGQTISLDLALGTIDPPLFDRPALRHTVVQTGRNFFEDKLDDFYLQSSTQWDGFGHIRNREHGFWQGRLEEPQAGADLGMAAWAEKGIVGPGVLLDVARYREAIGRPIVHGTNDVISAEDVRSTAAHFDVRVEPGDVCCVRTGWIEWYRSLSSVDSAALADDLVSPGLAGTDAMAQLLWDWQIAAVVADNPAIEPTPGDGVLHRRLIPLLGMAVGELFDLAVLSEAAADDGRYRFLFMSAPLRLAGGLGSPANAVAVR